MLEVWNEEEMAKDRDKWWQIVAATMGLNRPVESQRRRRRYLSDT